ncbi:GtrA family protein [Nocardioides sp. BP30]|uniref:GtrA family protein n=1 Tax=Nocardioides sp. BP30 TaxID=3036374 RepID=UPI0024689D23|nr:GtrA family protein [Nocardioides sp. BP30]WGL51667.1 GtrA family protein [Nocardioides sp. BP30]
MSRVSRIVGEAGRFMAVGAVSTAVAVLLYNWLAYEPYRLWSPLHRHITTAYIVSHAVGMLVSYELSRRWTFKERADRKPGEGFLSYAVINIITMITIPVGCLWFSRHVLDLQSGLADNISGNVVGLLISQVARFYLFRRFVFHRPIHYIEVYDDPSVLPGAAEGSGVGVLTEEPTAPSTGAPERRPGS